MLVGFEFGDTRRPYVIGGLINGKTEHPLLSGAVKAAGMSAQVVKRGLVSRTGNQLTFEDEIPSPLTPNPPTTGTITLGDADGKLQLIFDVVNGELKIVCGGGVIEPDRQDQHRADVERRRDHGEERRQRDRRGRRPRAT